MKTILAVLSVTLLGACGALGFVCVERTRLCAAYAQACESRDALASRVSHLEATIKNMNDDASRNQHAPLISAVKAGQRLVVAREAIRAATTSLSRANAEKQYKELVESLKGYRVVFKGKVKDVGSRIVSFSQLYVSIRVTDDLDVKFIFEETSRSQLLDLKSGDEVLLEGYVVSTGDLLHDLTVGGPTFPAERDYDEAMRLCTIEE